MKRTCLSFVISLALLPGGVREANAQQQSAGASAGTKAEAVTQAPLDEQGEKVRRVVEKVGVGGKITVFAKDGHKYRGSVNSFGGAGFDIVELDLKQVVAFKYADVKKVRRGTRKRRSGKVAALGGLGIIVFLAIVLRIGLDER